MFSNIFDQRSNIKHLWSKISNIFDRRLNLFSTNNYWAHLPMVHILQFPNSTAQHLLFNMFESVVVTHSSFSFVRLWFTQPRRWHQVSAMESTRCLKSFQIKYYTDSQDTYSKLCKQLNSSSSSPTQDPVQLRQNIQQKLTEIRALSIAVDDQAKWRLSVTTSLHPVFNSHRLRLCQYLGHPGAWNTEGWILQTKSQGAYLVKIQ